jgi:tetratricopeptide (TPR) repeat protein
MNNSLHVFAFLLITITCAAQIDKQEHARQLAASGNLREAVRIMDEVIATSPPRASYYRDKANYLLGLNEYEETLKTLTSGILIMPDSAYLYDMRGTLMEGLGYYDEAINDFTLALEKAKGNTLKSHLLANRGGTKFRVQDFEGAYQDLIASITFDSTNIDALNNLAAVCDEVDRPGETLKYLEKIISINPDYVPAYVNIGFKHQRLGQHTDAIKYFNKAIAMDPDEPLAYSNRSFSKLKMKDMDGAMKDINHSINLMPRNSYAYKVRALIKIDMGMVKEACADLKQALELGYSQQYGKEVDELIIKNCKD